MKSKADTPPLTGEECYCHLTGVWIRHHALSFPIYYHLISCNPIMPIVKSTMYTEVGILGS